VAQDDGLQLALDVITVLPKLVRKTAKNTQTTPGTIQEPPQNDNSITLLCIRH
jgi:hypothetical protein